MNAVAGGLFNENGERLPERKEERERKKEEEEKPSYLFHGPLRASLLYARHGDR